MNPVALLVLQVSVAVKCPVQFPPQVQCFLALSCSRRTCTDEFPMISAKEFSVRCPQDKTALTSPLLWRRFVTPPLLLLFGSLAAS